MTTKKTRKADREALKRLARLAESFVRQAGITRPPVDPLLWCGDTENIRIHESELRGECDGLLVFHKARFHLFYRPAPNRKRFTQAHEVAHYLIDEHHAAIRNGSASHVCKTGFITDSVMEREADTFAAALLMPGFLFKGDCPDPSFGPIGRVASAYDVSLTAAVLRTMSFTDMPAAVVVTVDGRMKWYFPSDDMALSGVHTVKKGYPPPAASKTAEVCAQLCELRTEPISGGKCFASDWFENAHRDPELWEEVLPMPAYNQVLTLLVQDD